MTIETANALYGYFRTVYILNQNIIKLFGIDIYNTTLEYELIIQDTIQLIPRIIPYAKDKKTKKYKITKRDGLLEFSKEIPLIRTRYEEILSNHYDFLIKVKEIRNKLEHKMHGAKSISSIGDENQLINIVFDIKKEKITINVSEFIKCIKDINVLFSEIQNLLKKFAIERGKTDYVYYQRMTKFSFCDFNKLYDSDMISIISKLLYPF